MPNTVPAAAEGLPSVTRPSALATLTAAVATVTVPAGAAMPAVDPSIRLGAAIQELEAALGDWGGGKYGARVYPRNVTNDRLHSVVFNVEMQLAHHLAGSLALKAQERDRQVTPELTALIDKHRKAWKRANECEAPQLLSPTEKQEREYERHLRRAAQLMDNLMAVRCRSAADRTVKAEYLARQIDLAEVLATYPGQLAVLLRSFA